MDRSDGIAVGTITNTSYGLRVGMSKRNRIHLLVSFIGVLKFDKVDESKYEEDLREIITSISEGSLKHPPYFGMMAGEEEVLLWMVEGSHRYVACSLAAKKMIGQGVKMRLIRLSPFSMIICRGDVTHAGGHTTKNRRCWRFHMYFIRLGVAFGDVITHFHSNMFVANERDKQEPTSEMCEEIVFQLPPLERGAANRPIRAAQARHRLA